MQDVLDSKTVDPGLRSKHCCAAELRRAPALEACRGDGRLKHTAVRVDTNGYSSSQARPGRAAAGEGGRKQYLRILFWLLAGFVSLIPKNVSSFFLTRPLAGRGSLV